MKRSLVPLVVLTLLASLAPAQSLPTPGEVSLDDKSLAPGARIDLTGQWLFKPSYALAAGERPESDPANTAYLAVPVPQLLSRIQWWLDDSEDFKRWEDARLKSLGFDTEKSDDGWYRLWVHCPAELPRDRRVFVEFDGVAMRSAAFLNGHKLGDHAGMFSRFDHDLTPHLKPGKNLLAVHVAMEGIPDTDVKLGEAVTVNLSAAKVVSMSKGMFGPLSPRKDNREYDLYGIWQPVRLVVRGPAKIDDAHFVPTLTSAKVEVEARALSPTVGKASLQMTLKDKKSGVELVTRTLDTVDLKPDRGTWTLEARDLKPKHWTPADPNLYALTVTLAADGQVLDRWTHDVGFRTFEVRGNQLRLNGKPYWLRGANQLPYGKNPFSPQLAEKLIQLCHDHDIRFTRTHCTPWNEAWLDAADRIGLAVSVEGIRPWAFAGRPEGNAPAIMPPDHIVQHWLMENEDVVKRCRNHPSVFLFTVGNEMLLRDAKSLPKWRILSDVTKQTRRLAPNHPVICSSDHVREPELYESLLKPNDLDDGDIDDLHRYFGWYADSPFVLDMNFEKELAVNQRKRPLIGQEFSTGYPDLDTGLPVWRYTRDLVTPQAWVGRWSYPPNDPDTFLEHNRAVTKRLAEKLRYQRADKTAGFSLFSLECWLRHSYDPAAVAPYPVLAAAREYFAPLGLALETSQRRFYAGDTLTTTVFVTNDDEQFADHKDLRVTVALTDPLAAQRPASEPVSEPAVLASLPYYRTASVPVSLKLPDAPARKVFTLVTRVTNAEGKELSRTADPVEVFPRADVPAPSVTVIRPGGSLADLAPGKPLRQKLEAGATVVLLSPGKDLTALFPDDIADVKPDTCEFADPSPVLGTPLGKDLRPMDVKWWTRKGDSRAFVATQSHVLKPDSKARSLLDFIPAHSYIPAERVPAQFRTVLFEIPLGNGRLWVCDLDLPASQGVDPAADLFARNLHAAAADPASTAALPVLPSHDELVKKEEAARTRLATEP